MERLGGRICTVYRDQERLDIHSLKEYTDYNYFEDDFHEEAGFNMDNNRVWSGKVDTGDYARESYTSDRFVFIKNRSRG